MSVHAAPEFLPTYLLDPRALRAWRQVRCEMFEPESVEVLRRSWKSTVYRLAGSGADGPTIVAKRCPAATACLEELIYREFLPHLPMPSLRCYGMAPEPEGGFCWLFLEDAGSETYSPSDGDHRILAARWLGAMHHASRAAGIRERLPDHGPGHYLRRLRSVRASLGTLAGRPDLTSADEGVLLRVVAGQCDTAEAHWSEIQGFHEGWPGAVVHGDFAVKNLRIHHRADGPALMVLDWEMAGWGVPATDMAQFIGRCASPDLDEYRFILGRELPDLDGPCVRRLADHGNLLRVIDKIFWLTIPGAGGSASPLRGALPWLRRYEPQFAAVLGALGWEPA